MPPRSLTLASSVILTLAPSRNYARMIFFAGCSHRHRTRRIDVNLEAGICITSRILAVRHQMRSTAEIECALGMPRNSTRQARPTSMASLHSTLASFGLHASVCSGYMMYVSKSTIPPFASGTAHTFSPLFTPAMLLHAKSPAEHLEVKTKQCHGRSPVQEWDRRIYVLERPRSLLWRNRAQARSSGFDEDARHLIPFSRIVSQQRSRRKRCWNVSSGRSCRYTISSIDIAARGGDIFSNVWVSTQCHCISLQHGAGQFLIKH